MNSFGARSSLSVSGREYEIHRLDALQDLCDVGRLPYSIRILLENLLRHEDGRAVTADDIRALASWAPGAIPSCEIAFTPARVLLQDFTGVPAVVDLAAMRAAMHRMGGDARRINPLQPVELVIDHSVQVDHFGQPDALSRNVAIEAQRNHERYLFLRWGQQSFDNFKVVPPNTGIIHQVNLEYLARVVFDDTANGVRRAFLDTLVGTDSHTTMVNGLGVLGWGVGGIEAEAAMLGQPVSMLIPEVVGFRLTGRLPEGATATDAVLTVVEMLRRKGVVGKFVEFYGEGLDELPLADRAMISNMGPEYGATCGLFPIDAETLRYLRLSGRPDEHLELVEEYCRAQGMWREPGAPEPRYGDGLELDLGAVEPCLAGPRRPQDRVPLRTVRDTFETSLAEFLPAPTAESGAPRERSVAAADGERHYELRHGAVVIAAITSCTNTSNPAVMLGAGLVARKARARGLNVQPWVKTSLAPGSQVVTEYLRSAGLLEDLEALGFHVVGYGCTTCIGNSGPLPEAVSAAIREGDLAVASVLSGNRNFEGRIHALIKMNYLASPPLVVAYALAGRLDFDPLREPLGTDPDGQPVLLKDVWPTQQEIQQTIEAHVTSDLFRAKYSDVYHGDESWRQLETPAGDLYAWDRDSTYIKEPPFFLDVRPQPDPIVDLEGARCLALLGDTVTTDHISPAGAIGPDTPAGRYLIEHGVEPEDFNSYGSRRGNHEVMMRGTFANVRLRNRLAPGTEGGFTVHLPDGEQTTIYEAAMCYQEEGVPLVVLAGKEYGTGSSRDWAAKGTRLLGVKAVVAESFERIHRSNLIGMGVLPLQFPTGQSAASLGLTGQETFSITGLGDGTASEVTVTARPASGEPISFRATVRLDTPNEVEYYRNGGILHYVLRRMHGGGEQ